MTQFIRMFKIHIYKLLALLKIQSKNYLKATTKEQGMQKDQLVPTLGPTSKLAIYLSNIQKHRTTNHEITIENIFEPV